MKKLLLILLCLPLLFTTCKKEEEESSNNGNNNTSLTWKKSFSGYAYSVQQNSDGGYIIVGEANHPNSGGDSYLINTDANGNIIWSKNSGYSGELFSVDASVDGGYILTGNTWASGQQTNLLLMKIDANGNEQWSDFSSNSLWGVCVQQTIDGGYVVFTTKGLIKIDANGNELWNKSLDDINYSYNVTYGQQTSDGGYICTGESDNGDEDAFLAKFDTNGIQQWIKRWDFGNQKDEYGSFVEQTTDGGYILGVGANTSKLIKTDSDGNEIWIYNTYVSEGYDGGFYANQTLDGSYITACADASGKIVLTKIDSQGNSIWNTTTYSIDVSNVMKIYETTDLGFIILGNSGDIDDWYQGDTDIILIKTDSQGNY